MDGWLLAGSFLIFVMLAVWVGVFAVVILSAVRAKGVSLAKRVLFSPLLILAGIVAILVLHSVLTALHPALGLAAIPVDVALLVGLHNLSTWVFRKMGGGPAETASELPAG